MGERERTVDNILENLRRINVTEPDEVFERADAMSGLGANRRSKIMFDAIVFATPGTDNEMLYAPETGRLRLRIVAHSDEYFHDYPDPIYKADLRELVSWCVMLVAMVEETDE